MKKFILITTLLALSNIALAEYNLNSNLGFEWGYSGFEISPRYISLTSTNKDYISTLHSVIEGKRFSTLNFLSKTNPDKDVILNLGATKINNKYTQINNYSVLLGYSNTYNNRTGIKVNFNEKDIGGEIFIHQINDYSNYTLLSYIDSNQLKNEKNEKYKNLIYGITFNYEKNLENIYLGYSNPSYYINTNFVKAEIKAKDKPKTKKISSSSLKTEIGMNIKNEIEFENIKITTSLGAGIEHEFLAKEKYVNQNKKDKDITNAIVGVGVEAKLNETISLDINTKLKKSLNHGHSAIVETGIKIAL